MNLTVQNGYPVEDFQQGRDGQPLDLAVDSQNWLDRGLELANPAGKGTAFTALFGEYVLNGAHPEVAYQTALDVLDIQWQFDKFLTIDKNETTEI